MSRLQELIEQGRFVVTAECPAIDGGPLEAVSERLAPYRPWVDAMNATDNPAAHAHCSPLASALAIRHAGIEPVMQLVCRDRNRLALQAEIAGAALHGIDNLCCLTGDDVTAGDEPESRRVFDLDGPQLVRVATTMTQGRYLSGRKLEPAPRMFIGAVESPGSPPLHHRVERGVKKWHAGARFLQLQVVYEDAHFSAFMQGTVERGLAQRCALIPSVCIVGSPKALRFMDEQVPGISVPARVIERVESAPDPKAACFDLAVEFGRLCQATPGVAGIHIISFRKDDAVAQLCGALAIPPVTERDSTSAHDAALAL